MVAALKGRHLLSLTDLSVAELEAVLQLAIALKQGKVSYDLRGKILGLLFTKASTRTRVSFTAAMAHCCGSVIDLLPNSLQVSRGEPIADTARILSSYLDVIAIRTYAQAELEAFAASASIPVINALTDLYHPCQIVADLQTVIEVFGQTQGLTLTYVGDGNNVAHSLLLGGAMAGMHVRVATPANFVPDAGVVAKAQTLASLSGGSISLYHDAQEAVAAAHVLYTDVWASMGQEDEAAERLPIFTPYQINQELLNVADPTAIVLHCLPAHRGEEITDAVIEGKQSRVWQQAENRLHAQKALLVSVLGATSNS